MRSLHLRALVFLAALACFAASALAQQYKVTNLGNLSGFTYPSPHSINNLGQVAGGTSTSDFLVSHPFLTGPNALILPSSDLGLLTGATSGSASSVNNSGQVAGTDSGYSDFSAHAFRLDPGNPTLVQLGIRSGALSGIASSFANGINGSGQVTGGATESTSVACSSIFSSRAFRTTADGLVSGADDLGTLLANNCRFSDGYSINTSAQVVGYAAFGSLFSPTQHAFLATPGESMQDLGTLGTGLNSTAFSINDAGQIVGQSDFDSTMPFHNHAFLTSSTAAMQDLGTLGGTWAAANSINNAAQIVGNSTTTGDFANDAFIYENNTMTDLNSLIPSGSGWVLQNASSINDLGQIVGTGLFNGVYSAFRLDPPANVGVSNLITELSSVNLGLTTAEVRIFSATLQVALAAVQRVNQGASGPGGQAGANFAKLVAVADLRVFIAEVRALVQNGTLSAANGASLTGAAQNLISAL